MQLTKEELLSVIVMDFAKQNIGKTEFTEGEVVAFVQMLFEKAKTEQSIEFMLIITLAKTLVDYMTSRTEEQVKNDFISAHLKRDLMLNLSKN